MRAEQLYEFIVPLIFIMIWAVTWILNRETQALPPRSIVRDDDSTATGRDGGREPGRNPRESATGPRPARSTAGRPERPPPRERRLSPSEAIVYVEPGFDPRWLESTEPAPSSPAPPSGSAKRRSSRARTAAAKPRSHPVPETPRELTQEVSSSLAAVKAKPLTLTPLHEPLSSPISPLSSFSLDDALKASDPAVAASSPAPAASELRKTLADPARLREIFVWNEVVQPPLALRRGALRRP